MEQTEVKLSRHKLGFSIGTAADSAETARGWLSGICPVCGYAKADVDPQGVLWCPACGYSKKGCYT